MCAISVLAEILVLPIYGYCINVASTLYYNVYKCVCFLSCIIDLSSLLIVV